MNKRIISILLILSLIISIFTFDISALASSVYTYYTDDMEAYQSKDIGWNGGKYCSFGSYAKESELSTDIVYSGSQSIKLYNRYSVGSTLKVIDIFGRELTKNDVGKTFCISFMIYPDKSKGVYNGTGTDYDDTKANYSFTEDELSESLGTQFSLAMSGPNDQKYTYRTSVTKESAIDKTSVVQEAFAKWNEWTEVHFYYTVQENYLDNGLTGKGENTLVNSFRIGQTRADCSVNQGIADTFYIDDVRVSEVGAKAKFSKDIKTVTFMTEYLSSEESEYARSAVLEYSRDGRFLGAKIGDKTAVKTNGKPNTYTMVYDIKSEESDIYTAVYGGDFTKPISPKLRVNETTSEYYVVTEEIAVNRAKEMLELSSAEYKDVLTYNDRLDIDNAYFFASEDVYVSSSKKDTNFSNKANLSVKNDNDAYVKFDISSFDKSSVAYAYISFYANILSTPGTVDIYNLDCNWDENSVTYNTRPEYGEKLTSKRAENLKQVYYFDVTSTVNQALKDNKDKISFCIKSEDGYYGFNSKESTAKSFKPRLIFEGIGLNGGEGKSSYDETNYVTVGKTKDGTSDNFEPTPTRVLSSLTDFTPSTEMPNVSEYGGWIDGGKYEATGFYRTELIDGRWWIITPDGYKTLNIAVDCVEPYTGSAVPQKAFEDKYGTVENWANVVSDELREYGFNGAGPWVYYDKLLPYVKETPVSVVLGMRTSFIGAYDKVNDNVLNVFDPRFEADADRYARHWIKPYADSPYVLGIYTDNEPIADDSMLVSYLTLDINDDWNYYSYYTAWEWLKSRHGENATINDITHDDKNDWVEFVYDRYMKVCTDAIRKYDKNHMMIGPKLDKPHKGSFRGVSKWVDIIAYDYYGNAWTADMAQVDQWYMWAGKPMLNSEWYVKGADAVSDESGITNESGVGYTVPTQADRGRYYQSFVLNMLESRVFVGWQWFRYTDNDPDKPGLSPDSPDRNANKGILTRKYEPWNDLLSFMKEININSYRLTEYFDR